MKRITKLLGAGILLLCSTVFAAVPQLINFQGVLRDGSGNPVVGSNNVTFTIYTAPSSGMVLWAETTSVTTNTQGLFSVLLGADNPVPDSTFNDSSRYLGIKVASDPEMTPRQQLVSVAYSLRVAHFIPDFGLDNTFIGRNAGNLTMSGQSNTASGYKALASNTTGLNNTASGAFALFGNTIGNHNTASGRSALSSNTTGTRNTASGYSALLYNTTGNDNTASGYSALEVNSTGNSNTANGANALWLNTTGSNNTASGYSALYYNSTGYQNTASGGNALYSNTAGFENTASGGNALQSNTTGYQNTASGANALTSNWAGIANTAGGAYALWLNTTGSNNTACGVNALLNNTNGSNNTAIGIFADVSAGNLTNATAIGNGAIVNASNKIRLGNAAVTVLECQVGLTVVSDRNQKENFRSVNGEEVLEKIRGFELSSWNYKGHDPREFRHYGPMAQDFFAAFGDDGVGKIGTETTLNSGDMAGILMIAVQALEKEKELMKTENADLKARIEHLEEVLKEMQAEKPQAEIR